MNIQSVNEILNLLSSERFLFEGIKSVFFQSLIYWLATNIICQIFFTKKWEFLSIRLVFRLVISLFSALPLIWEWQETLLNIQYSWLSALNVVFALSSTILIDLFIVLSGFLVHLASKYLKINHSLILKNFSGFFFTSLPIMI